MTTGKTDREKVADIIRDAGGQVVGRTRLQKIVYLSQLAGFGEDFNFEYHNYGPYSEELVEAVRAAEAFELITEDKKKTNWGGTYSIFTADPFNTAQKSARSSFLRQAAKIDAVELELAATAAFLKSVEKVDDPWQETARRKPEKASEERIEKAKAAYKQLLEIDTLKKLPNIL